MPKAAEQGGQPERRIGQILKSKSLGRRRVTLVVRREMALDSTGKRIAPRASRGIVMPNEGGGRKAKGSEFHREPREPQVGAEPEGSGPSCMTCGRPLTPGVRFCAACGTHNFDSAQRVGQVLAHQAETHLRNQAALENRNVLGPHWFVRWWYWFFR
jgi:hypothetical protein